MPTKEGMVTKEKDRNICGLKIRELRKERGMEQIEVSALLSVDYKIKLEQSDISEIERSVRGVRDFELKAFSEIFEVSADLLLGK